MHHKNGFTLTEILIVVAILGILASLAIPRLFPQTERARAAEAIGMLSAIRQGEEAFRLARGTYQTISAPPYVVNEWAQIGMEVPLVAANNGPFFNYSVTVGGGGTTFTATADRQNVTPGGPEYSGGTTDEITLNQAGAWGGDHPFRPQ